MEDDTERKAFNFFMVGGKRASLDVPQAMTIDDIFWLKKQIDNAIEVLAATGKPVADAKEPTP